MFWFFATQNPLTMPIHIFEHSMSIANEKEKYKIFKIYYCAWNKREETK